MLADALGQYLIRKQWSKWFLVIGPRPEDAQYAAAIRRTAKRFGARIVEEKTWTGDFDLRRSASTEVPLFTQGPSYDVLVVADEIGDFGEYLPYQTWDPRPVVGTQGLTPTGWHRTIEQWGAAQLQSRFHKLAGRTMTARDYAAWAAARAVGEAATRTQAGASGDIAAYIQGPTFELAGFKGRALSFRPWDGQLRQPIGLAAARNLVIQAPLDGFLHQFNEMDTLGFDQPETACKRETP
jgi:ABC transporter substrate binding protein (PQQ-dependent alcohol dehydrogenase system)